ncbi:hypothetical protein F5Y11DRAFT_196731 [Daldinia sp. FL1419]|nr:hypothetical protein F5Y11DRAFT_196731 [Daldinia sp. FL1419]
MANSSTSGALTRDSDMIRSLQTLIETVHPIKYGELAEYKNPSPWLDITTEEIRGLTPEFDRLVENATVPPGIDINHWCDSLLLTLVQALQLYVKKQQLNDSHIMAFWELATRDTPDQGVFYEKESAWTLGHNSKGGFSSSTTKAIQQGARVLFLLAHTDLSDPERTRPAKIHNHNHFLLAAYTFKKRRLWVIDSIRDRSDQRANYIKEQMTTALQKLGKPIPGELHTVPIITQRDSWSCGFWCAYTLHMIKRRPRELLSTVKNNSDHYEKLDNYMKSLAELAGIRVISDPAPVPIAIETSETIKSVDPPPKQVPQEKMPEADKAINLPKRKPIRTYSMKQGHKRVLEPIPSDTPGDLQLDNRMTHGPWRVAYFEREGPNLYTWPGETSAESAVRPQPSIPLEWPGWDEFERAFDNIQLDDDDRSARQADERDQRALNRATKRSKVEEQGDYTYVD